MNNKTLGIGVLLSLTLAMFVALFEDAMSFEMVDGLFALAGLGLLFFGIWGGIRLMNN